VRNAFTLLGAVALLILVAGAINHAVAFDIEYVAGTVSSVSLAWVAAVVAALLFVVGAVAVWLTRAATGGTVRRLEAELQSTYERLRQAEAQAARASATPSPGGSGERLPSAEGPSAPRPSATPVAGSQTSATSLATSAAGPASSTTAVTEVPGSAATLVLPAAGLVAETVSVEQTAITTHGGVDAAGAARATEGPDDKADAPT